MHVPRHCKGHFERGHKPVFLPNIRAQISFIAHHLDEFVSFSRDLCYNNAGVLLMVDILINEGPRDVTRGLIFKNKSFASRYSSGVRFSNP